MNEGVIRFLIARRHVVRHGRGEATPDGRTKRAETADEVRRAPPSWPSRRPLPHERFDPTQVRAGDPLLHHGIAERGLLLWDH